MFTDGQTEGKKETNASRVATIKMLNIYLAHKLRFRN